MPFSGDEQSLVSCNFPLAISFEMKKLKGVEGEIVQFKNKFSQVCSGGQVWLGLFNKKKSEKLGPC